MVAAAPGKPFGLVCFLHATKRVASVITMPVAKILLGRRATFGKRVRRDSRHILAFVTQGADVREGDAHYFPPFRLNATTPEVAGTRR
jgi:hypothetical protein